MMPRPIVSSTAFLLIGIGGALFSPPLIAKEKQKAVTKITLAFEDQDYPPWVLKNGSSGLDIFL